MLIHTDFWLSRKSRSSFLVLISGQCGFWSWIDLFDTIWNRRWPYRACQEQNLQDFTRAVIKWKGVHTQAWSQDIKACILARSSLYLSCKFYSRRAFTSLRIPALIQTDSPRHRWLWFHSVIHRRSWSQLCHSWAVIQKDNPFNNLPHCHYLLNLSDFCRICSNRVNCIWSSLIRGFM